MDRLKRLEQRVEQLEQTLFDVASHKARCHYIYIVDLQEAMRKNGVTAVVEKRGQKLAGQKLREWRKK